MLWLVRVQDHFSNGGMNMHVMWPVNCISGRCSILSVMGVSQILAAVLFLLCLVGGSSALGENCTDYRLQFERVFSVPGDVAMLNSTLVSPGVFDFGVVPYNVTWYHLLSGRELGNETGRILVRAETLWFLNVTMEDAGDYVCIVSTPSQCYRQDTKLVLDEPVPGHCGRPLTTTQTLTSDVNDILSCPLKDITDKLESYSLDYSLKWYKNCTAIKDGDGKFTYRDVTMLKLRGVEPQDSDSYTCTLTFNLTGFTVSISETIFASVKEEYELPPEIHDPTSFGEVIKAQWGSSFTKRCWVFVPCVGRSYGDVYWFTSEDKNGYTAVSEEPSERIYMESQSSTREESPRKGVWLERLLKFSHLTEQDFYKNYTCFACNDRGCPHSQFTLLPADPTILLPIGSVLGGVTVLFVSTVVFYYIFKIDIVLSFRRAFPVFYKNTESDGKRYDAYIAYPRGFGTGASGEVEMFALHTLPQVLERTWGYKLFIAGRDSLPGQAIVDSVEENIQASRCLLLLYTASTFNSSDTSDNNNQCSSSDVKCNMSDSSSHKDHSDSHSGHSSYHNINISDNCTSSDTSCTDGDIPGPGQQFEHDTAMYRALMEGSLKVVLVEMEEVSPAQLALFPESVRHLRKKQGAVCWWKNQKTSRGWGTRLRERLGADEEKGGQEASSLPLSSSSRFWKEVRYHMPVRGKRAVRPENMSLLAL